MSPHVAGVFSALLLICASCAPEPASPPAEPTPGRLPTSAGQACDGIAGLACTPGLYCAHEAGVCRTTADAQGICRPRPQVCTRIYQPVCGCDGRTYGNPCEANAAGTSIAAAGACKAGG